MDQTANAPFPPVTNQDIVTYSQVYRQAHEIIMLAREKPHGLIYVIAPHRQYAEKLCSFLFDELSVLQLWDTYGGFNKLDEQYISEDKKRWFVLKNVCRIEVRVIGD